MPDRERQAGGTAVIGGTATRSGSAGRVPVWEGVGIINAPGGVRPGTAGPVSCSATDGGRR
jgi:hypothetical protein